MFHLDVSWPVVFRQANGKELYLVKWKGYSENSWEPDENIGAELAGLKRAARERAQGDGKKRKKKEKDEEKVKKEKKEKKKKRRRNSSEKKRRDSSESDAAPMPPPMMPQMMPGMMPGMPFPMDGKGKGMMMGKGMPPMFGKGMPLPPFPPWFDPKGFGKGKGFGKHRQSASEMQRFASERKHRMRDLLSSLHDFVAKDLDRFPKEKLEKAQELFEVRGLVEEVSHYYF